MTRTRLRRAVLTAASLTTAVALTGCGTDQHGSAAGSHNSDSMASPTLSAAPSSPGAANAADVSFAQAMIPHHQQAVQMADLAVTRATDTDVKQLATQIKAAQGPEITTMTRWLAAWGTGANGHRLRRARPASWRKRQRLTRHGPGPRHAGHDDRRRHDRTRRHGRRGLRPAVPHDDDRPPPGAISMARNEIGTGANTDAKALAQQIADVQQAEIDTMNRILARL
ncbi:DUF305 domain-containing protein [Micromonospora sp. M12]